MWAFVGDLSANFDPFFPDHFLTRKLHHFLWVTRGINAQNILIDRIPRYVKYLLSIEGPGTLTDCSHVSSESERTINCRKGARYVRTQNKCSRNILFLWLVWWRPSGYTPAKEHAMQETAPWLSHMWSWHRVGVFVIISLPQSDEKHVLFVAGKLKRRRKRKRGGYVNGSFIEQATVISRGMTRLGRIEKPAKFELRQNERTLR